MNVSCSSSRDRAWMVWIVASVFYAYQYIIRVMPNIMLDDICQRFSIDALAFGQFSGIYYLGYSLLHIPVGIMLDRFGARKIMTGCVLLTVVGLLPLLFSEHWAYPILGRFLVGVGSSCAILGVFKVVRMAFSEARFSRMLSFSVMIGLLGAIYGGGPVSYMRDCLGYEAVLYSFIWGGIALSVAAYFIVPDVKSAPQTKIMHDVKEVLSNRSVIIACLSAGLMVGPLEGFADVWGCAFLKQVYGLQGSVAASLPSLIFIGMCFGAPVLSFIGDRIKSNIGAIVGAGCVMSASFILLLAAQQNVGLLSTHFVLIGICSAYQILAIFKASTFVRAEVAGLTTAVANMIIMIFGYGFHTAIGCIVSAMGGRESSSALLFGVSVIPVALIVGTIGFISLIKKESQVKEQV